MAISFVQWGDGQASSGSTATVLPANTTIGNTVVLAFQRGAVVSIASSIGTFTQIIDNPVSSDVQYWACINATGASRTITVTTASGYWYCQATEYSGSGISVLPGSNANNNSATASVTVTPVNSGDFINVALTNFVSTSYPSSPWVNYPTSPWAVVNGASYQQVSSTSPVTATWTASAAYIWTISSVIVTQAIIYPGNSSSVFSFSANATAIVFPPIGGNVAGDFEATANAITNRLSTGNVSGSFSTSAYHETGLIQSLPTLSVQIAFNPTNIQGLPSTQTWTDVTSYVRDFQSKIGRQHYLDRVEAGTINLNVSNRNGFFLNGSVNGTGYVLQPRLPIQVTASWNGTTYPIFYGIIDDIEEKITDQLNSDLSIKATDLIKFLSLRYMASTNFWATYANISGVTQNWFRCTPVKQAVVTGATYNGGYVTFSAINNYAVGDTVAITGLGTSVGTSLNNSGVQIVAATTSSFSVSSTGYFGGVINPSISSGNGSSYLSSTVDVITGSATLSGFGGTVAFSTNGAQVYNNDGCIDLSNGASSSSSIVITPTSTSYGIDFWILGQGLNASTNDYGIALYLYTNTSGISTWIHIGADANGNFRYGTRTLSGATVTWSAAVTNGSNTFTISDGYWHHVGFFINGSNLYAYVDGYSTVAVNVQSGTGFSGFLNINGPAYVDEIISSGSGITTGILQNRFKAGILLQQGTPVTATPILSGDRIAEILCIAGFGYISGGQVVLNSNTYFINDSATAWVNGTSTNGFVPVEPYYWDSPVTGSTALDLILQVCDTDIGSFYQETNGTFSFYNQLYYGTWSWSGTSGTWTPSYTTPSGDHVWTDNDTSSYAYYGPSLQITRDDVDTWTTVKVSPQSGTEQVYENYANEPRWGFSTLTKSSTLHTSLNLALSTANFLGYLFSSPLPRVGNVELRSETRNGANMTALLNTEFGDVVTFKRTSPNASTSGTYPSTQGAITTNMVVESVQHDFQADPGYWHTSFILDPYPIRS